MRRAATEACEHRSGPQRSLPMRQRQEVQALLRIGARPDFAPANAGRAGARRARHPRQRRPLERIGTARALPSRALSARRHALENPERLALAAGWGRPRRAAPDYRAHAPGCGGPCQSWRGFHDRGLWTEALESLGRTLEINPHDVQALVDSGNALRALGRSQEAIVLYRRALKRPASTMRRPEPIWGMHSSELGDCAEAAKCYDLRACERARQCADPLQSPGQCSAAARPYRPGSGLEPSRDRARSVLDNRAQESGADARGARAARRGGRAAHQQALALEPRDVDALNNLGKVLLDLNQIRDFGRR